MYIVIESQYFKLILKREASLREYVYGRIRRELKKKQIKELTSTPRCMYNYVCNILNCSFRFRHFFNLSKGSPTNGTQFFAGKRNFARS